MEKNQLTLKQNLRSTKIFLNLFGLFLEDKDELTQSTKLKIFNKENLEVGIVYFENETIKIKSETAYGILNANYKLADIDIIEDAEYRAISTGWDHIIIFEIDGNIKLDGNIQISANIDTEFGNNCRAHCQLKYMDKDNNKVILNFMNEGKLFSYEAKKEGFREVLEINPWNDLESFMYHIIRKGEYDGNKGCFPSEIIKFVWHNGIHDRKHLRTVSHIIENYKTIENNGNLYESVGNDETIESTIQKGLLMQQIDYSFAEKITKLQETFTKENISLFDNLINIIFTRVNDEERKALFGIEINKIFYPNGADNLIDAYFDTKEKTIFSLQDTYVRKLKNK